jgi:coenzyme PQQ precursor peptide PqqA
LRAGAVARPLVVESAIPAGAGRPRRHFDAKGNFMQWQTPSATDIRLGFEITMYVAAR